MNKSGYFVILNHIAHAVDHADKEVGFKDLIELDMMNRAALSMLRADAHLHPEVRRLMTDLTQALYPPVSDINPTIEQRMMLVQAMFDSELEKILGDIRIFLSHSFTQDVLIERFGFVQINQEPELYYPYYLRQHIMTDQAVFCDGELTTFAHACAHGKISPLMIQKGLLPLRAYARDTMPDKYRDIFFL